MSLILKMSLGYVQIHFKDFCIKFFENYLQKTKLWHSILHYCIFKQQIIKLDNKNVKVFCENDQPYCTDFIKLS